MVDDQEVDAPTLARVQEATAIQEHEVDRLLQLTRRSMRHLCPASRRLPTEWS
jgi:hypothetical protein